jgi:hypothetical protein
MAFMRRQRQSGDRLLRVALAVPIAYAAFESAYRWSHGGFHMLTPSEQSAPFYAVNGLLGMGPTLLFAAGAGLLVIHKGERVTWSIVLSCSLAVTVYCALLLRWEVLSLIRWWAHVDKVLLGTYMSPAVYLVLISVWSLLTAETRTDQ